MKHLFSLFCAFGLAAFAGAQPITIAAVGDLMPGSAYPFADELPPHDAQQLLSKVKGQWDSADIVFGNLEGVLTDDLHTVRPCPAESTSCYRFGMPARYAALLKRDGFTVLNSGNNHVHDFGDAGRLNTLVELGRQGITAFGTLEQPTATQILPNGIRIGWVGYAPHTGANPPSVDAIREQVAALKRTHNIVIVSMHIGAEGSKAQHVTRATEIFLGQNRGNPHAFAHAAVDAGADLVLGHGPHVLRGMELYKGRLIAYSLGNFATYGRFNLKGPNGIAGILKATVDENGKLLRARFISTRQERGGADWQQGITPSLDPTHEAARQLSLLSLSDFPESPLYIDSTGRMTWSGSAAETQDEAPLSARDKPANRAAAGARPAAAAKPSAVQTVSARTAARPVPVAHAPVGEQRPGALRTLYIRSRNAIRNLAFD